MKKIVYFLFLFLPLISVSCSDEVTDYSILMSGDDVICNSLEGSEELLSKNGKVEIVKKHPRLCSDWNVFHRIDGKDTFIFSFCPNDCNEWMKQEPLWSSEGVYCAMYISNSSRFRALNRLLLYKFKNGAIERKLDVTDRKIASFKFENDKFFVFKTKDGVETKQELD
jgi:hypothetical protein